MQKSESIAKLTDALSKVQGALKPALKDSENPHFRSKYADLTSVWDACREPLSKNGLAVVQTCDIPEAGNGIIIETTLSHISGEWMTGRLYMPVPKFDPQGVGSALTYARRYSFCALVGVVADEDDDANAAMSTKKSTPARQPSGLSPKDALIKELTEACKGDKSEMQILLSEVTHFTDKDGKGSFMSLDKIDTYSDKWIGGALGKLRKKLAEE